VIVSHSKKIVYLAPPKTGTISVQAVLEREPFNGEVVGGHAHHDVEWSQDLASYFHFITVRHPYSRAYSLWRTAVNHRRLFNWNPRKYSYGQPWALWFSDEAPTFKELLECSKLQLLLRRQWRCSWHLEQIPKEIPVVVVRLENFYEDLQQVEPLRDNLHHVVHANKNLDKSPKHWSEVVTPEHAERIRELWAEDFDRFGYNRKLEKCTSRRVSHAYF
jgi:hypothetical protein